MPVARERHGAPAGGLREPPRKVPPQPNRSQPLVQQDERGLTAISCELEQLELPAGYGEPALHLRGLRGGRGTTPLQILEIRPRGNGPALVVRDEQIVRPAPWPAHWEELRRQPRVKERELAPGVDQQ